MADSVRRWMIGTGVAAGLALGLGTSARLLESTARHDRDEGRQAATSSRGESSEVLKAIAAMRQDFERLSAEVAGLGADVGRMRRQVHALQTAEPAGEDGAAEDPNRDPATNGEEGADATARYLETLESSFKAEKPDRRWAYQAQQTILEAFAGGTHGAVGAESPADADAMTGSSVGKVECRTTLCRLEVSSESSEALGAFMHEMPRKVGRELPRMTVQPIKTADGRLETVVYLGR